MDKDSPTESHLKIELLDPRSLREHPLHKFLPRPDEGSGEYHAFNTAVHAAGPEGIPPIFITSEGFVIDGERRRQAAIRYQWELIACISKPDWEAMAIILESIISHRTITLGCKAYLAVQAWPDYSKSAHQRQISQLKNGSKTGGKIYENAQFSALSHSVGNQDGPKRLIASRVGCSVELVEQAITVINKFKDHKIREIHGEQTTFKDYYEPRILNPVNPMSLGSALKGMGGNESDEPWSAGGSKLAVRTPAYNFELCTKKLAKHVLHWDKFTDLERAENDKAINELADACISSDDLHNRVKQAFKNAERRHRRKGDA